ncbi:Low molecular weight phosphotyrosine protein phosphatase [Dirofilaria immitis]
MHFTFDVTALFVLLCFQMMFSRARDKQSENSAVYTFNYELCHSQHHYYHHKKRSLVRNTADIDLLTQHPRKKQILLAKPYWPWP